MDSDGSNPLTLHHAQQVVDQELCMMQHRRAGRHRQGAQVCAGKDASPPFDYLRAVDYAFSQQRSPICVGSTGRAMSIAEAAAMTVVVL